MLDYSVYRIAHESFYLFDQLFMKKTFFLLVLLALIANVSMAQSDNNKNLTDYTFTEKILDVTIICFDAIESPTKYNSFAKEFISVASFPKRKNGETDDEYKGIIAKYIAKLPISEIEKILSKRKKAHDILYGPRPY